MRKAVQRRLMVEGLGLLTVDFANSIRCYRTPDLDAMERVLRLYLMTALVHGCG
jgi:hypothetical protein